MAKPVLVIAIEAMEISLVRQGVAEGWLPTIAGLLDEGSGVRLAHGPDLLPGAGWTSVFTGRPAHEHLLIFGQQLAPGTTRIERVTGNRARVPVFWQFVSDAGLRSTVVSAHSAPRVEPFHGTQVHWGTGDPYTTEAGEPWSNRPDVLDDLRRRWPGRRFGFLDRLPQTPAGFQDYLEGVCSQIRMQGEALAHLVETTQWDLFFGTFYETHEAGHLLWHLQAAEGMAAADDAADGALRQPMRRVYQEVDAALGRVLARRQGDTCTFVLTTTGMTGHFPTYHATRSFLLQGGWLRVADRAPSGRDRWLWWAGQARSAVHQVTPLALRRALSRLAPTAHASLLSATPLLGADWSATSAFPLPNDTHGAIRLNLAGREPAGVVEPGADYERLAADIAATARDLVDARRGTPVTRQVHRMDHLIGGPVGDVLPDLVVEWAPVAAEVLDCARTGPITVPTDPRTGDHRPEGFLICAGPGLSHRPGALDGDQAYGLLDIAPTLLTAVGVPVPPSLRGRVIGDVLPP